MISLIRLFTRKKASFRKPLLPPGKTLEWLTWFIPSAIHVVNHSIFWVAQNDSLRLCSVSSRGKFCDLGSLEEFAERRAWIVCTLSHWEFRQLKGIQFCAHQSKSNPPPTLYQVSCRLNRRLRRCWFEYKI